MTSYIENETSGDIKFFQNILLIKENNFFYDSYAWKRLKRGVNNTFLLKNAKKTSFWAEMTTYVKNETTILAKNA